MALLLVFGPRSVPMPGAIFAVAGIVVGVEEAFEHSPAAELVAQEQHGMAFGTLAAVNPVGDFVYSAAIAPLWTANLGVDCIRAVRGVIPTRIGADLQGPLSGSGSDPTPHCV
jgi:hypothetical protein